ncbi:dipeptidase [Maricaulis sp.]|uniref:dipeptidase n=1 Tax=Maricaulis sp. TaxID=1486257 RepID=UPI003A92BB55
MRIVLAIIAVLVAAAAVFVFAILPPKIDADMNVVTAHDPYLIVPEVQALHDSLRVADLHSDMLLWRRDPNRWNRRGHTDLPRLRAGRVALQVFSSVTKTPADMNYDHNTADSDNITPLAIVQLWPLDSWTSIYARARFHARRLNRLADGSDGEFVVARTRGDLAAALERRASDPDVLVGILATEGGHPFEGDLANIDGLYDEGYRMIGLQHFFDNELGGSLHGVSDMGLTDFGRAAVARIVERGLIIDLAHSSQAVVRDVLDMTDVPLVISHTGIHGHCEARRNIPDALMSEVASRGGVIGIGFWEDVTCDDGPAGIAATILAAIELVGVEHVALGSDYDGTVTTTFDASEYAVLTDRLLEAGLSEADIRAVMGENTIRFFLENLPEG